MFDADGSNRKTLSDSMGGGMLSVGYLRFFGIFSVAYIVPACMCVRVYVCACVCVCVYVRQLTKKNVECKDKSKKISQRHRDKE